MIKIKYLDYSKKDRIIKAVLLEFRNNCILYLKKGITFFKTGVKEVTLY